MSRFDWATQPWADSKHRVRTSRTERRATDVALPARVLADQAFSRAAGAPLIEGNSVRLLRDGADNYPAWLDAIAGARRHVHLETYFVCADAVGTRFADALLERAACGVQVRIIYDWLGNFGKAPRAFWNRLRSGGVQVRCYNPPRWDAPFGWLSRDHRKVLVVDGEVAFITGLCVGQMWLGDAARNQQPWRDTGVAVRGPAVADVERAFAHTWALLGPPPRMQELPATAPAGDVRIRIVASEPATAGMLRLDQLVATLARERVWLTDAYYAGTAGYVQTLRAAARQGVDVRLLLPGATDIPLLRPLSRAGYRLLLEAGIRVFEWNGVMLHAKTAVVDGRWARVGSTNLNIASWFGNCELDAVVEDQTFAQDMERMYLHDLENATEIVLDTKQRVRAPAPMRVEERPRAGSRGSAGRAAAGAMRIGNALGAAFTARRVLGPVEARIMVAAGCILFVLALLFAWFPRLLAYPVAIGAMWIAATLLYRGYRLQRERRNSSASASVEQASSTQTNEHLPMEDSNE
jgi:cardiolipin synthase